MSKTLANFAKTLSTSFKDLLNIEDDVERPLEDNRTVMTAGGAVVNTAPNKSKQLMEDISSIIDQDEDLESPSKDKSKGSKAYTTKDYLDGKKKNIPSASKLVNLPLQGSFHGLEGEELSPNGPKPDLSGLTAKDLKKSFDVGLNLIGDGEVAKRKSKSKNSLSGSKNLGSALSLVNNPLKNSSTLSGDDGVTGLSGLGVTAKDLRRSMHGGLNESRQSKSRTSISSLSKSKGSIASLVNAPLNEQFGGPQKTTPLTDISLYKNVGSIINGPDKLYSATESDRKRATNADVQSAKINMSFDDPSRQPLMYSK